MSRDHLLRLLDLRATDDPFFFPPFPSSSSAPSYFFSSSYSSSCPLGFTASSSPIDLLLPAAAPLPFTDPFLLDHRVSALERALAAYPPPAPRPRRKCSYTAEADGGKVKWSAEDKPSGSRNLKWKWESKASPAGTTKVKWAKEIEGKGCLNPWSHSYSVEEDYGDEHEDDDDDDNIKKNNDKVDTTTKNKNKTNKVEIDDNTAGCVAIKKAFERGSYGKGKRKELTPQDAALLIQINYRAHLAHRSQVLRCLRDLAVAKAKLKEIRSLFYNISYRRRVAHDSEERQRFAEKIIVLLLTVDALEGPDYMVRNAKRSMLEELEGMLEIVDPQPPGQPRTLSRREFDLPEGGSIPKETRNGVKNVVKIVEDGK